jgi:hypothetical protein
MSNNSSLPIIAVGALGLSSISCVISSFTGFLVSGDSNVESNTSTSNTSTDTSNTSTDTSNTSTDTSNTSAETDYAIPHQIELGGDGWCVETDAVHQDVPGCGRICSSAINVGSKRDGTWGPWADNTTVASTCVGAKLDEIWEVQDDGTRKLADGYIVSTPAPTPIEPYTIKAKTRFRPRKMTYGYVNISDGSKSKYSTNSLMSDTTVDACISKCNELDKCTSFQWVPGDKYCNMVSDKPFSEGSLLSTMIESNDRYEIHIKP